MPDKKEQLNHFLTRLFSNQPDAAELLYENPYAAELSVQRYNLERYLNYMLECSPRIMLVGEAPGYKGCQKTGIPFVSGAELLNTDNNIILGSWDRQSDQECAREFSSQYMLEALRERYSQDQLIPLMWNAFPYHPYKSGNRKSNRAPSLEEIEIGRVFIEDLKDIFDITDDHVYAVGRKAQKSLGFSEGYHYIRHPSFGGKEKCRMYLIEHDF